MMEEFNFCQRCGNPLSRMLIEGRERSHCFPCSITIFSDPKVVAGVLIEMDARLVMIRRGNEPGQGLWSFPSGYVDRWEPVETATIREAKEETGLEVSLTGLLGVYSRKDSPVILLVYTGTITGGDLNAGLDAEEVGLFNPNDLPDLAFSQDRQIIEQWESSRQEPA